ncbi:MAG: segregation and condensation protein A [Acidithiobacillus sp.]|uniref:segregation and condensation protein A n=1 Tax=Acidithiobacillus sp. TaxID=1872118 RepID=UPI003D062006
MSGADRVEVEIPEDLYIPPDALELILDRFSGPLDLLLWLIRRNRMDIRDIPVAEVTRQYLAYLEEARRRNLPLAADYLLMAAWLTEIKARLLLPVAPACTDEEALDPREELARRLQSLAQIQAESAALAELPQEGRDFWLIRPVGATDLPPPVPSLSLGQLCQCWVELRVRQARRVEQGVQAAPTPRPPQWSLRQRMLEVLQLCQAALRPLTLADLLPQGKLDPLAVGLSLLAVLELLRQRALYLLLDGEDEAHLWTVRTAE